MRKALPLSSKALATDCSESGFHPRSQSPAVSFFHYDRTSDIKGIAMRVGQFFSLQRGRVGQYLSPRVLVVRSPFRAATPDRCYLGFDHLKQAQAFAQHLARRGIEFQVRRSQVMPQDYEIRLRGRSDLARSLAYWDRRNAGLKGLEDSQMGRSSEVTTGTIAA